MPTEGSIIRPPSEARSGLLQLTKGCSLNSCSFCGAYTDKRFSVKHIEEVYRDIEDMHRFSPEQRRFFLTDGDALAAPDNTLNKTLDRLNHVFPRLVRISSYANAYNINNRDISFLKTLKEKKFKLIYIGLESGSESVLKYMNKQSAAESMLEAVRKSKTAGIKSSVIVLLGLGSKILQEEHIEDTARILNKMQPDYLSFLSLMLLPETVLYNRWKKGEFVLLNKMEMLTEMYRILEKLELTKTVFRTDHASNYLSLSGRLPRDKDLLLGQISRASEGMFPLRPEYLRGL